VRKRLWIIPAGLIAVALVIALLVVRREVRTPPQDSVLARSEPTPHEAPEEKGAPAQMTPDSRAADNSKPSRIDVVAPNSVVPFVTDGPLKNAREVISERHRLSIAGGERVVRILKADFKYPLVRVVDTVVDGTIRNRIAMVADHLMVHLRSHADRPEVEGILDALGYKVRRELRGDLTMLVEIPHTSVRDLDIALQRLMGQAAIRHVGPDFLTRLAQTEVVNDPRFVHQWALKNRGQEKDSKIGGDIDIVTAWGRSRGSASVVVGVLDSGINYNHSDLAANIWMNPFEAVGDKNGDGCPGACNVDDDADGLVDEDLAGCSRSGRTVAGTACTYSQSAVGDDDENGYVDDVRGWNFSADNNNPMDDNSHGTHVAGTIGAVGDNNEGIIGVAPVVKLAALKTMDAGGSGTLSDAVEALVYARKTVRAFATNNSWGSSAGSAILDNEIERSSLLMIAAAGNDGQNNDLLPVFPANSRYPNTITVAATDAYDILSSFSNFGTSSVDIAAPGTDILSTFSQGGYIRLSGTSMAAPHVTGAAALLKAVHSGWTSAQIKQALLAGADVLPTLEGSIAGGRRLNIGRSMRAWENNLVGTLVISTAAREGVSNRDQMVSPGETFSYDLYVTNRSKQPISGAYAQVTTPPTTLALTIVKARTNLPEIPGGATVLVPDVFRIAVPSSHPAGEISFAYRVGVGTADAVLVQVVRVMDSPALASGSVVVDDKPFAGATLVYGGKVSGVVSADSQGAFSFSGPPGRYVVRPRVGVHRLGEPLSLTLPDQNPLAFKLISILKAKVVADDTEQPVPDAIIDRALPDGTFLDSWRSDANGGVTMAVEPGQVQPYLVRVRKPGEYLPVQFSQKPVTSNVERSIRLKRGGLSTVSQRQYVGGRPTIHDVSPAGYAAGVLDKSYAHPVDGMTVKEVAFIQSPDGTVKEVQHDVERAFGRALDSTWISRMFAVNDYGVAAGVILWNTLYEPFVYSPKGVYRLPPLSGYTGAMPHAINARGEVVGISTRSEPGYYRTLRPTLWTLVNGAYVPQDLGVPSSEPNWRTDLTFSINGNGRVAGTLINTSNFYHAMIRDPGQSFKDIGAPSGASYSSAAALSEAGSIAGVTASQDGRAIGFLWEEQRGFTPIDDSSSKVIVSPTSIHDASRSVVGLAYYQSYLPESFLWRDGAYYRLQDLLPSNDNVGVFVLEPARQLVVGNPFLTAAGTLVVSIFDRQLGSYTVANLSSVADLVLPPRPKPPSTPQPRPNPPSGGSGGSPPSGGNDVPTVPTAPPVDPNPAVLDKVKQERLRYRTLHGRLDVNGDGTTELPFTYQSNKGRFFGSLDTRKDGWSLTKLRTVDGPIALISPKGGKGLAFAEGVIGSGGSFAFYRLGAKTPSFKFGQKGDRFVGGCDVVGGDSVVDLVAVRGGKTVLIRNGATGKISSWVIRSGAIASATCALEPTGERLALLVKKNGAQEVSVYSGDGELARTLPVPADSRRVVTAVTALGGVPELAVTLGSTQAVVAGATGVSSIALPGAYATSVLTAESIGSLLHVVVKTKTGVAIINGTQNSRRDFQIPKGLKFLDLFGF
jgi:subtilisin family serine protease